MHCAGLRSPIVCGSSPLPGVQFEVLPLVVLLAPDAVVVER